MYKTCISFFLFASSQASFSTVWAYWNTPMPPRDFFRRTRDSTTMDWWWWARIVEGLMPLRYSYLVHPVVLRCAFVWCEGWCRIYCQSPSWRKSLEVASGKLEDYSECQLASYRMRRQNCEFQVLCGVQNKKNIAMVEVRVRDRGTSSSNPNYDVTCPVIVTSSV